MVKSDNHFHKTAEYYLSASKKLIRTAVETGKITERDSSLITEYLGEISAAKGISPGRRMKVSIMLVKNREHLQQEYAAAEILDIYKAIDSLKTAKKADGSAKYKQNTILDRVWMLKNFYIWLIENDYSSVPKKKVRAIELPAHDDHTVSAGQLLTQDEVRRIISAAENTRDRALISMLYEGAFRIGEIGVLQWKNVELTSCNLKVNTSEKTGKPRFIPMVVSKAYLTAWMNDYPGDITPEGYVFVTLDKAHKQLQYAGVVKQIRKAAVKAGVTKHIKPHIFRHSRITHLLQSGLNETTVKLLAWGSCDTNMIRVYQHLQNQDIEKAILNLNGIVSPEMKEAKQGRGMKPINCPRCGAVNPPTAKYCSCGQPLTEEGIKDKDTFISMLLSLITNTDPSVLTEAAALIQAKSLEKMVEKKGDEEY